MTSSGQQLTTGQRCLLELLERKLLNTIKLYATCIGNGEEDELYRLKEKIRRISARQKRFTLQIINGNGNNTIPKETFFQALGLITKEALSKLNSKTNERRRRTTANPRFSHEAIQAKRALEPIHKRLEPRIPKEKRESSSRRPQKNQQSQINNNTEASININRTNTSTTNNNNNNLEVVVASQQGRDSSQQQGLNSSNNNNDATSGLTKSADDGKHRNLVINNERSELLAQFGDLQKQINTKVNQIKSKRESNKRLEKQNELIRKRGLDLISTIKFINPDLTFQEEAQHSQTNDETADIWIDMKCDESLEGLD